MSQDCVHRVRTAPDGAARSVATSVDLPAWNHRWARTRIHGTTKRQVWAHFIEADQPAPTKPPATPFALFQSGMRTVGWDAHLVVDGAFYPVPAAYMGQRNRTSCTW